MTAAVRSYRTSIRPPLDLLHDMKALITGGAGFIGSNLARRLVAGGDAVVVLDDLSTGSTSNLSDLRGAGGFELHVGSVHKAPLVPDISKLERMIDFRPGIPLSTIIGDVLADQDRKLTAQGRPPAVSRSATAVPARFQASDLARATA